jgi:hypothetical protein
MSGGHFNYKQYELGYMADEIEQIILENDSDELDEYGERKGYHFDENTIEEFKHGLMALRTAQIYVHRIDWLVSGDDGEDSFHSRLAKDLEKLTQGVDNE